jgi:hypothetical protein
MGRREWANCLVQSSVPIGLGLIITWQHADAIGATTRAIVLRIESNKIIASFGRDKFRASIA